MKIKAELNYLRISPRKVRAVANAIRGKRVPEAERALAFLARRAAQPLLKLLRSAVAGAKANFQITSPDELLIRELTVNAGPSLKRSRPRAFGRAFGLKKRTSHIRLVLETSGPAAERRRRRTRPNYEVVSADVPPAGIAAGTAKKPVREREAFLDKAKIDKKPVGFVRRMFRRKAI